MKLRNPLKLGHTFADRFRIMEVLGEGFFGSVYVANDVSTEKRYIVKVFDKETAKSFPEYIAHLRSVSRRLTNSALPHLSLPVSIGETEDYFYIVQEYLFGAQTLDSIIRRDAPLHPSMALSITEQIAEALFSLHSNSIVHADVKPANILVIPGPIPELSKLNVHLIDFGMVQPAESGSGVLIVGTYAYLPPEFRAQDSRSRESSVSRVLIQGRVGPYIDIYALGMVCMEMLTGKLDLSQPLSRSRIAVELLECNNVIQSISMTVRTEIVDFLFSMLSINSAVSTFSAKSIIEIATALGRRISDELTTIDQPKKTPRSQTELTETSPQNLPISQTLQHLQAIADSLAQSTAAFFSREARLENVPVSKKDNELLFEMNAVFSNALSRSKNSWRITVGMTVTSFVIIIAMMILAVTMAITTGSSTWTLIFGGASVSLVLGTLIWRPFDRMFRATILSQQLEMIHLQTVSAFRGTRDTERRIQLCREAITSLETLFREHAIAEEKIPETRKRKGN